MKGTWLLTREVGRVYTHILFVEHGMMIDIFPFWFVSLLFLFVWFGFEVGAHCISGYCKNSMCKPGGLSLTCLFSWVLGLKVWMVNTYSGLVD